MSELILIALIILVTFGLGKMPQIASTIGKMRVGFKRGLSQEGPQAPIDITPSDKHGASAKSRKPGKFEEPVEDARVDR